jgi:hypothetical protein
MDPVSVQVLTHELAQRLGANGKTGVRVTRVMGGAASKAGLLVGDLITAIDGNPIEATQPSDADLFATMIRQYKIGSTATLTVLRDGRETRVPVTLDAAPRLPREMKKYEDPNFEFRVRDIAAADRLSSRLPADVPGVLVDAVREGGWAALGHLADGDLLLTINGESVADVERAEGDDVWLSRSPSRSSSRSGEAFERFRRATDWMAVGRAKGKGKGKRKRKEQIVAANHRSSESEATEPRGWPPPPRLRRAPPKLRERGPRQTKR